MELFKIICVTCKARLSVRNPAIIGQIVACPKCDSMVQVEAPAAAAGPIVAETVAPDSIQNVPTEPVAPNDFAEVPAEPALETPVVEAAPVELPPVEEEALQANVAVAKYKLLAWTLASVAVGAAIGGAVILFRGSPEEVDAKADTVVSPIEPTSVDAQAELAEEPTQEKREPELLEQPEPQVADAESVATVEVAEIAPVTPEETRELSTKEVSGKPEQSPRVASRFDALDLDPDLLDLEMLKNASEKSDAVKPDADFPDTAESPAMADPAEVTTLPTVRRDPDQKQNKATQSAEERLAQVFPAITVKAMSVADFLDLLSRLGGVPISVAPEQLQMAGITARKSVSLEAKEISLAAALSRVLGPLHLEYTTVGPQVVVVRKNAAKIREMEYPLDDLTTTTVTTEDIVGWVERFVLPEDRSTTLEVSETALRLEQPQELQYQVLIFLERLRLSRNLPPRSRFPVKRLASSSSHAALAERLGAPVTFTFSHYTALNEIVRYWQQELDTPILVDWPALGELDLWPETRVVSAVESKPWSVALDLALEPLGLGWRAAVGGTIEITSAEKIQSELKLELYQLRRKLGGDEERVLAELRSFATSHPAGITYDRAGRVLIVFQPAATQRLVYRWLVDEKLSAID